MKNWYLVSYDIRDDKRLRKVARKLEGFGSRLQYSVFRCHLSERGLERLRWELSILMESEDDLLVISLCAQCVEKLKTRNPKTAWPDESKPWRIL